MAPDYFDEWEEKMFEEYGYSLEEVCSGMISLLGIPSDSYVATRQRNSKRSSPRRSE
jgi:hypothetical protein